MAWSEQKPTHIAIYQKLRKHSISKKQTKQIERIHMHEDNFTLKIFSDFV